MPAPDACPSPGRCQVVRAIRGRAVNGLVTTTDRRFGRDFTLRQRTPSFRRRRPIPASARASPCDSCAPTAMAAGPKLIADRTERRSASRRRWRLHRSPEPAPLPIDHQAEFIEVPEARARPPRAPQSSGVLGAEPPRPESDDFVRDLNSASQHQLGNVTQADQAKGLSHPKTPPGRRTADPSRAPGRPRPSSIHGAR